jgi:hypothetical protein
VAIGELPLRTKLCGSLIHSSPTSVKPFVHAGSALPVHIVKACFWLPEGILINLAEAVERELTANA